MAKKTIKFQLSPTGKFNLAYNAGDVADFDEKQANELIESGYAIPVEGKAKKADAEKKAQEEAEAKPKAEKDAAAQNAKATPAAETATDKAAANAEKS